MIVGFDRAVEILRAGGLVAFPTETVYGLGGRALDESAVRAIFAAKGRPPGHPLILHARDPLAYAYADERAGSLARLWPGPLTLVLPRRPMVPDALTGGRDSVAVRCPDHPVALSLLDAVGPLAAPSANRFGALSPTTAEAVLGSLPGVPVLDGGPCRVGLESTIVDLTGPVAAILRPGALTAAELGLPLGPPGSTPAPGTLPQHYAPRTPVLVVDAAPEVGPGVAVVRRLAPPAYARSLYATLRELDNKGFSTIIVEKAEPEGIGLAVNDRLLRMAHVSKRNGPT